VTHDDLDQVEFADNPEPRCAVALLLDTSGSMKGRPIAQLNDGLRELDRALKADRLAALRVELAVITFGGEVRTMDVAGTGEGAVDAEGAFVTVDAFQPPTVEAHGDTPMGEAVRLGLGLLRERKDVYQRNGIDYFRPWMFLLTDGHPTDRGWEEAAADARAEEARKGLALYAVGVEGADMAKLARFSDQRPPLKMRGLAYQELFEWLSRSLSAVSHSRPGEQVPLPPVGWGEADTSS
jgi:uncharacterized protein YegL